MHFISFEKNCNVTLICLKYDRVWTPSKEFSGSKLNDSRLSSTAIVIWNIDSPSSYHRFISRSLSKYI